MNKKKQLRNQRRQERRGLYTRDRKGKHPADLFVEETKKINTKGNFIKMFKYYIVKITGIILCKIGAHQWVLQSGVEGTPKYLCRRCLKGSKKKW